METIKVNMTPCEDIKTIHASQNDNEGREWGFELHNNGDKIDSSSISDQLVFKAYEGGTEEILPENGSTPTTSPFIGDIKYPQGLLSDQEFLYRESPTEEDGLAKITDIKGNTLVWNQLVPTDWISTRTFSDGLSVTNNNDGSYTLNGTSTQSRFPPRNTEIYGIQGHKYYIQLLSSQNKAVISQNSSSVYVYDKVIYTAQNNNAFVIYFNANTYSNEKIIPMIIDLTQMFGSGNEPSTVEEFTSLFPLPYYAYNQGTLLSFMGNGIKTVGKNLLNLDIVDGTYLGLTITKTDGKLSVNGRTVGSGRIIFTNTPFYLPFDCVFSTNIDSGGIFNYQFRRNNTNIAVIITGTSVTVPKGWYDTFGIYVAVNTDFDYEFELQLEGGNTVTSFEPYTSSTLSLPISTYFTNGMDGVGTVYDELTQTGYVKRFASIAFDGSETWAKESSTFQGWDNVYYINIGTHFIYTDWSMVKQYCICDKFQGVTYDASKSANMVTMTGRGQYIEFFVPTNITMVSEWKTWLSNNPTTVKFELTTPLENYGVVDLGSLAWSYNSSRTYFYSDGLQSVLKPIATNVVPNILCDKFVPDSADSIYAQRANKTIGYNATQELWVRDANYTDATAFKQSLQGIYLLYEKQNPQGFTTATLVTENGEVALANENGVLVGKCNSDVSADAGFIEGKIKLSDEDGDVYSNKIQLHVERSPQ